MITLNYLYHKKICMIIFYKNEFDDNIEDENNFYLHQHIKDLINKQEYYSLNSNFIK